MSYPPLRSYVTKEDGVRGPITKEEHDLLFSNERVELSKQNDLNSIFSALDYEVYFEDRLLTTNERIKIKKIIEIFLND